jgi:VanZ family protein
MKAHGGLVVWVREWPEAVRRGLAWGYCFLLVYLLLTPSPLSPFGSWGLESEAVIDRTLSDHVQHIIAYAVLIGIFWWSRAGSTSQNVWGLILASGGHGIVFEGLQYFIPHREANGRDLLCNLLGVGLGAAICWGLTLHGTRRVQTPSSETNVGERFASRVPLERRK